MIALAGEWDSEMGASASHFSSSAVRWLPTGVESPDYHLLLFPTLSSFLPDATYQLPACEARLVELDAILSIRYFTREYLTADRSVRVSRDRCWLRSSTPVTKYGISVTCSR